MQWDVNRLLAALDNYDLVPVADPNTPTHMHRMAKAQVLKQLASANPQLYDQKAVDVRIGHMAQIDDIQNLMVDPQQQQPAPGPDPKLVSANASMTNAQAKMIEATQKPQMQAADLASKERIQRERIAQTTAVHPGSVGLVHQELGLLE
jgi:hypothetical protein